MGVAMLKYTSGFFFGVIFTVCIFYGPIQTRIENIIYATYEVAEQDCAAKYDDIGLKRLSIKDIERLI